VADYQYNLTPETNPLLAPGDEYTTPYVDPQSPLSGALPGISTTLPTVYGPATAPTPSSSPGYLTTTGNVGGDAAEGDPLGVDAGDVIFGNTPILPGGPSLGSALGAVGLGGVANVLGLGGTQSGLSAFVGELALRTMLVLVGMVLLLAGFYLAGQRAAKEVA
jgi:hypothetical protein